MKLESWPMEHHSTSDLWDASAKILTDLSRRDNVKYLIKATTESVQAKLSSL